MIQYLVEFAGSPTGQSVGLLILYMVLMAILGKKSQIDAWCVANPTRAAVTKAIRGILPDPLMLIQAVALLVFRRMPVSYQDLVAKSDPNQNVVRQPPANL